MSHRTSDHDASDSRAYLHHTVLDNGDALVDFVDESTGEVITETIRGYMPPVRRKDDAPFDPWDSPYWDLWHYELSDPVEVADLMAAAHEAETDRHDAPDRRERVFEDWIGSNLRQQVSPEELAQLTAFGAI
jgi:hypothetical protein